MTVHPGDNVYHCTVSKKKVSDPITNNSESLCLWQKCLARTQEELAIITEVKKMTGGDVIDTGGVWGTGRGGLVSHILGGEE